MIDVTFQLLLYFLLTTEFREDEGQIPGSICGRGGGRPPVVQNPQVTITLRSTGDVFQSCQYEVDNRPPVDSPTSLRQTLEDLSNDYDRETTVIDLKCVGAVRWKYVVEAYNAAVHNRFGRISFHPPDGSIRM